MTTFARLVGRISGTSSTAGSEAGELQARVADGAGSVAIVGTFDKDGLDVIGEIQGSGDAGFGGTRPASDPYVLYVETGSGDAETIKVYRPSSSANAACFIDYALNDSGSNETVYARTLGRVESSTNGSELGEYQVRIMNGGSGLETRFEVNSTGANVVGALTVDNVEVDVPDFVFDGTDGKAPEKLAELEQFIRRHNHLPEFPSAKDKKAWSSIDMVGTDMKLLERCERLTLHILALEKRLSALENNNN